MYSLLKPWASFVLRTTELITTWYDAPLTIKHFPYATRVGSEELLKVAPQTKHHPSFPTFSKKKLQVMQVFEVYSWVKSTSY